MPEQNEFKLCRLKSIKLKCNFILDYSSTNETTCSIHEKSIKFLFKHFFCFSPWDKTLNSEIVQSKMTEINIFYYAVRNSDK